MEDLEMNMAQAGFEDLPMREDDDLDDTVIKSIIESEIKDAIGYQGGELADQRAEAMDYYHGQERGDEIPGRSAVISMDVADVVEWILPEVIDTYASNPEAITFDAVEEGDEAQAEIESEYVASVYWKQCNGFLTSYSAVKDALMQKNGVVKIIWRDDERVEREEYEGLTGNQVRSLQMTSDSRIEILEITENAPVVMLDGTSTEMTFNIVLNRYHPNGKPEVMPVPPEQFLVNRDHNSILLGDARFVAHRFVRTASELIEMGFDADRVDELPTYDFAETEDELAREEASLSDDYGNYNDSPDRSQRPIQIYECYVNMDLDDDGIAERYQVMAAGSVNVDILSYEPSDRVPFAAGTPWLITHKFHGQSVFDRIKQIQDLKTSLWRNIMDNIYLQNNSRTGVVKGKVNLDDLLTSRPGGIVRMEEPGMLEQIKSPPLGPEAYTMLEYMDKRRSESTGISPDQAASNQLVGAETAHGIERLMSAKEKLVGLVQRLLGETLFKEIWLQLRELLMKNQSAVPAKINGAWHSIDPSSWRHRQNTTIAVGTGTGDKLKIQSALQSVLSFQEKLAMNPAGALLLSPKKGYNALDDFCKASGLRSAEKYFIDPESEEGQAVVKNLDKPKEPEMLEKIAMLEAQVKQQAEANKLQIAQIQNATKAQIELAKLELQREKITEDTMNKMTELELEYSQDVPEARV